MVVVAAALAPGVEHDNDLPDGVVLTFFVLNVVVVTGIAWVTLYSFMRDRERLRRLQRDYLDQELVVRQSQKLASLGTLAAGAIAVPLNPTAPPAELRGELDAVGATVVVASSEYEAVATEVADYLVARGVTFREAHDIAGALVRRAIDRGVELAGLSIDDFRAEHAAFAEDVVTGEADLALCVVLRQGQLEEQLARLAAASPPAARKGRRARRAVDDRH